MSGRTTTQVATEEQIAEEAQRGAETARAAVDQAKRELDRLRNR